MGQVVSQSRNSDSRRGFGDSEGGRPTSPNLSRSSFRC